MSKVKVAVLKTNPSSVITDYKRLFDMAEIELDRSKTTILKNNISWHMPYPSANTTPWQLEGVIEGLKERKYEDIVCVQNETVVTSAPKGERLNKYSNIFKKQDIKVLHNFLEKDMKWVRYIPKGELLVLDKIFPEGILIPDYFSGKNMIHLPTVKCHIYTGMTGALKNAFGGLLNNKRHYCHSKIHETLVDLLMIQKEIHSSIAVFTDGTTCGNGPGPRTMVPEVKDYILASSDSVAIDAISSKLMGFDPMSIKCIRMAHEKGLGVGDLSKIEVVGEDISNINFNFNVGDNAASSVGKLFWFGPFKHLQHLMFHTPIVYAFIFASAIYHDFIWYPVKGRKIVNSWQKETSWGKLFKDNY
jgi:uncharacterized protein (DUF362 family)